MSVEHFIDTNVFVYLFDEQAEHSFSFYDSLIIAAALESGCSRVYSEDM